MEQTEKQSHFAVDYIYTKSLGSLPWFNHKALFILSLFQWPKIIKFFIWGFKIYQQFFCFELGISNNEQIVLRLSSHTWRQINTSTTHKITWLYL